MLESNFYKTKDLLEKGYWVYDKTTKDIGKSVGNNGNDYFSIAGMRTTTGNVTYGGYHFNTFSSVSFINILLFPDFSSLARYLYNGYFSPSCFDPNVLEPVDTDDWRFSLSSKSSMFVFSPSRNTSYPVLNLENDSFVSLEISTKGLSEMSGFPISNNLDGVALDLTYLLGKYNLLKDTTSVVVA